MYVSASALGALCLLKCTRTLIFHFVVNVNDQSVYYIYSSFYLLFANSFSFSCIGCIVYFRNFAECLLIFMICLFLFERFDCVCHTQWFEYIQQIVSFFCFVLGEDWTPYIYDSWSFSKATLKLEFIIHLFNLNLF